MVSRVPKEWRVPIAWAVLQVAPLVIEVARPPSWHRPHGYAEAPIAVALVLVLVLAVLRRSRVAWWILVVLSFGAYASWVKQVSDHGLGVAWVLSSVLSLVSFFLLLSTPMRRFVRIRGRFAAIPG